MRKILLGLTGSVASILYKKLIDELQTVGDVNVILTEKSKHFIKFPELCDALEKQPNNFLYTDENEWTWKNVSSGGTSSKWNTNDKVLHIELRNDSSALVIAPCSANTLAKIANGICDNLLTTVARAWDFNRPFIIAPAMNTNMWEHPVTQEHIKKVQSWGVIVINPQEKMLACGTQGMGAMSDISKIKEILNSNLTWMFPLTNYKCNGIPIGDHPGAFGTQRKYERHTGVDLYTQDNAIVCAVESGIVVGKEHFTGEWDNSPWWNNTDCLLIEGATGVVCYGEIYIPNWIKVGSKVQCGQYIGNVVKVLKDGKERPDINGHITSMLHMELYPHGTVHASNGFESWLQDPTDYLLKSTSRPHEVLK